MSVTLGNYYLFGNYDTSYVVMNQIQTSSSYVISGISSDGKNMISYQGTYPNYNTYYSNNYGQTWLLSDMPTSILGNYCTPLNYPNVFYVGAVNGTNGSGKLYRSLNGGANWNLISTNYGNVSGLCVNDDDTILYLSNYNNAVYYSTRTGNSSFNYTTNSGTFTFTQITNSNNSYRYTKLLCSPDGSFLYGNASSSNRVFTYTFSNTTSFNVTFASAYNNDVCDVAMSSNGSYLYASLINNANYTIIRSTNGGTTFTDIGTTVITKNIAAFINCDPTGQYVQVKSGASWWVSTDYGNTFSVYGGNAIPNAPALGPNNRFYLLVNNTTTRYGPVGAPTVPSFSDLYWIRSSEPYALPDTNPGTLKESYRTTASTAITFPSLTSDISNVKFVVSNGNAAVVRLTTGNAVIVGTTAYGGSPSQTVKNALNLSKNVIKIVCNDTAFCAIYTPSGETHRRLIHWGYYGTIDIETIGNSNVNFNNISTIQSMLNLVDISDIAVNQSCAFAALDTSGVVYSWGDKNAGGAISDSVDLLGVSGVLSTLLAGTNSTFGLCSRLITGQKHFGVISSSGRGVVWGDKTGSTAFIYDSAITGVDDILMATNSLHNCIFMRIPETSSPYSVSVSNINASKTVSTQSLFTGLTTKPRYTTQRMGVGRTTALITNSISEYLWVYLDNGKRLITFGVTTNGIFQTLTNNSTGLNYTNVDSFALTPSVITFSGSGEMKSFATQVDANVTNSITNYKDVEELQIPAVTTTISPTIYYTFESATSNVVTNLGSTGPTNNLTLYNGANISNSITKYGLGTLDISGAHGQQTTPTFQYARINNTVTISNTKRFSVSFWFNIKSLGTGYPMLFHFGTDMGGLNRILVGLNPNPTPTDMKLLFGTGYINPDKNNSPNLGFVTTNLSLNTWYYVGWSANDTTWLLRLNNNSYTYTANTNGYPSTSSLSVAYPTLGSAIESNITVKNLSVNMDQFRFFNGALTEQDLTNLYNEQNVLKSTPGILKYNLNRQLKYKPSTNTINAYGSGASGTTALTETYTNAVEVYTSSNTYAVSQTSPSQYTLVEAITNANQKTTIAKTANTNVYFGSSGKGLYALEIPNNPKLSPKIIPPSITRTITYYVSNPDLAAEKWSTYALSESNTSVVQIGSTYTTYDNISNTYVFTGVSLPTLGKKTLYIWNTVPDLCYNVLQFDLSVSIIAPVTPSSITLTHTAVGVIDITVTQTSPPESYFAAGISYYYYRYTTGVNYSGDVSYYNNWIGDITDETYPAIKKTLSGLSSETFTFYVMAKSSITGVTSNAISKTITLQPVSPDSVSVSMLGTNATVTVTDTRNFTTNNITYWYYAYKTTDASNNSNNIDYYTTSGPAFTSSPTVFTIPGLDADAVYFIYIIARNAETYSTPVVGYETNTNIILSDRYDNYKLTPYVLHDKNPGTIRDFYRTNATGITFPTLTSDISGVKFVVSNGNAAVVRLVTGNAVVVGSGLYGGKPSQTVKAALNNSTNVIKIVYNDTAFCAIYVPSGQTRKRVIHWGFYGLSDIETIGTGNANFNNISTVDASLNLTDISDIAINSAGAFVALNASGQIFTWGDKRGGGNILSATAVNAGNGAISTWLTGKTLTTLYGAKFHFGAIDTSQNGIIWGVHDPSSSYASGAFHTATSVRDFYFTNTQDILRNGFITWASNNVSATYNTTSTTNSVPLITGSATTLPTFTLQRMNGGRTTATAIPSTSEVWVYQDNAKRLRMFLVNSVGVPTLYSDVSSNNANFFSATPSVLTYKEGSTLKTYVTTADADVTNSITKYKDSEEPAFRVVTTIEPTIYYTFESATSNVVTNFGTAANSNLTLYNGASISTTSYKYGAGSFDTSGSNNPETTYTPTFQYGKINSPVIISNVGKFSVSFWFNIKSLGTGYPVFFDFGLGGGNDRIIMTLYLDPTPTNSKLLLSTGNKTLTYTNAADLGFVTTHVPSNTWHYVGWSASGDTWYLRLNNSPYTYVTSSTYSATTTFTYASIGASIGSTSYKGFSVNIDNFRFFNGSLTEGDLTNLYNEGLMPTPGFLYHNYNRLLRYNPSSNKVNAYGSGVSGTTALTETYTNATDIYTSANAFAVSQTTPSQYTVVEAITNANNKNIITKPAGSNIFFGPSGKGLYAVDVSNNPILSPKIIPTNASRTINYYVSNPDLAANRWSTYALSTSDTSLVQVGKTYSTYDNLSSTYTFTDVSFATIGNRTLYIRNIDPDLSFNVTQFDLSVALITPVVPSTLTLTQVTSTSIRITVTQTSPPESYFAAGIGYYYYQYTTGPNNSGVDANYSTLIGMITDDTYPSIQSTVTVSAGVRSTFYVKARTTIGTPVYSTSISQSITTASSAPLSPNSVTVNQSGSNALAIVADASNTITNGITYWYYAYKTGDVNNSGNIGSYTEGPAFTSASPTTITIPGFLAGSTYIIYVVARNILGDSTPVASPQITFQSVPLAPSIDTGNTKSTSSGTISVSLLDTNNIANNGVYYTYLVGDISYNKSISFGVSTTAVNNASTRQIGVAITAPGTTRLAIFTYLATGATPPASNKLYYSRILNGTWGTFTVPTLTTAITEEGTFACAITPDARRLIISAGNFGISNHSIYWADASGLLAGTSTSLTFRKINQVSTILSYYVAVSDDGRRIAVSTNTYIYYSDWSDASNNYGPLQTTLDIARVYSGIYISPDKNKIVYGSDNKAYYALWNGTNYSTGTAIPGTAFGSIKGLSVYKYGLPEEIVVAISENQTSQYSVWNGSSYNTWTSLTNGNIPAINNWGLAIDSSGTMYYNAFSDTTENRVYQTIITSSSTITSTFVDSGVQFTGTAPNNLYKFDVSGLTLNTMYKINVRSKNNVGTSDIVSASNLSVLGSKPVISSIVPVSGLEKTLRVNFSQTYKGTTPVTYYYSRNVDGSNRFPATDGSFVITDASQTTTVYVIADNSAGNVISLGVSGTPYLLGSKPTIDSIVPSVGNTVTVNFTQTILGGGTTTYYYGFDGSGVRTDASAVTSPLIITGLNNTTPYSIYLVARNEAGDISSNAFSDIKVLGTKPVITGITKNIGNSVTVAFTQLRKGTDTTTYYGSFDGSNIIQDASSSGTSLTISNLTDASAYTIYMIARNQAGDVMSDPSSNITILGTTPTLTASQVANVDKTVRLTYGQTSKGTLPVTYFYTTDTSANTANRIAFLTDSSTVDVSGVTGATTYYAIASNSAGNVRSAGASVTPNLIGSKPTLTAVPVLNSPGVVRITYFQTTTGTTPVTYYYTTDSNVNTTERTAFPNGSSSVDLSGITGTTTYYVVANNVAGNIISDGSYVTPYFLGSEPTIGTIIPGTNQLSVAFSQDTLGTLPTRYYYSTDGTTKLGPGTTTSPLLITGISGPITFYLIADNSAGVVRSISTTTATPYFLGSEPTIDSIVPNASIANSVIVNFTQSSVGNGTPVYYYGFAGSGVRTDASATASPMVITGLNNTTPYSIYLVARNEAGDISSSAYPNVNVRGVQPVITGVTQNIGNSVTVAFSQSQKGTDTTVYNYSLDGSNVLLDASSSGTSLTIPNLTSTSPYSIYLVARNPAGNVFSEPSLGVNILGSKPTIDSITKNIGNSITVAFSQSQKGTDTTIYYGSIDGSSVILDASSSGTSLTISNLTDASAYNISIIARNPAGDVVSDASSGIHILGTTPVITGVTRNVGNSVTVAFSQSQKGTGTTTYYGSINGSSVLLDASSSDTSLTIRNLTDASAYSIYVIAINPAGSVVSDPSLNVSILGSVPSFTLVPQTNNLRGTITHADKGTLPVTYYYSSDGVNNDFEVSFPTFDISGTVARTFYIIAENSAGKIPSSPVSGTPYIFGDVPVISSVVPGSEKLTVNFSQDQTGTTPVKYYYSYDPSGTTRIAQVNPPSFDISGTQTRTVYIVVDNSAGTLVSAGVSGTPYVFGTNPLITLIQRGSQKITVTYTQSSKGTEPVKYYYSFDRVNRISDVTTNTFDISYDVDSRIGNKVYNVAVSGGLYSFTGEVTGTNPSITVVKGSILTFNVNSFGHPLWIKTTNITGTDYAVTSNITNNGTQSGTIIWNTSDVNTGTYYYICQYHSSMVGSITIIPPENNPLTTTKNVSIIADNSAGTLVSDDVSGTPYTFGSVPQIQSVTPGQNKLTVLFSQDTLGNTPSSYSYSYDPIGTNPTAFDSSSTFIVNGSQPRTIYVIATNLAGSLISTGVSGTPFVVGDTPSIDDVVPGPYSLTVKFSQQNAGNTPVTYYYSYSVDGSNPQGPVSLSEFTVTASTTTTIYVVADSSSGYLVSDGFTKTPFILGNNPVINDPIIPGAETLTVSFTQSPKGTEPVIYYYSFLSDGSGRVGPVTSPFTISTTTTRTVYVVASNSAGNLVSAGKTATPYTFANKPVITDIVPSPYKLTVYFTPSTTGTTPITYYYSEYANGSNRVGPVTSPFDISGSVERTIYIVADNSAGNVVSTGFTRAPYILGSQPLIQSIVPGPNKITVTFESSVGGTEPVYHYYSYDPNGSNGNLITSPFDINGTSTRTVYIVASNPAGNLVSLGVSGTPFVVGGTPIIESVISQTNNLQVTFSHPDPGNTEVSYYYSDDASGNNLIKQVNLPTFDISGTITRTIYVVSINSAGKLVSAPETATPFTFGTQPVIESVTPGTEKLSVKFRQDQTGTTPVTYYYSFLADGSNAIGPVDTSFNFTETIPRTIYIVARNAAGNLVSAGVSGTPFIYGSKPIITGLQPGLNRLTVSFTQTTTGTTPVRYYYSEFANGSNRVGPVTSPFDISNINTLKTVYIVADNSAGTVISDASSATPYTLGTNPVVSAIVPGTNKLTVSFSQTSKGTEPVTYYYSELSNGTNRVGPVTSPFDISNILVSKTVYIIAENSGGTLISISEASGTPYILGSSPSITNVQPGTNSLTVTFNRSVGGTTPVTHYYSYDSSGLPRVAQIPSGASTFTITDISSAKTIYIVAENPAGNLVSVGASGTPYIFGDLPVISSVVPQTNKLVVNFSQVNRGTLPVTYYYSFDGSGRLGAVTTPSFEIATLVSRTVYIIADNSAGTLVSAGVSGTPYIFGSALNVTLSSPSSNTIRVSYNQATQGTTPTTYKYVLNGGSAVVVSTIQNGIFDISGLTSTAAYSIYMVATNAAGDLSSNTLTQPVLGTQPIISSVVPQTNKLVVNFSQVNRGTLPVTYYYSFDGVVRLGAVTTPSFEIATLVSRTVYIIADNSAGTLVSAGVSGTPYIVGVPPMVSIESGVNKITVYFSNTGGTAPVTYYYSDASNGSNPIGPVTSPFDISNITIAKTIYIVASNIVGNVISNAATGVPYIVGSAPVINSIRSGTNSLIVDFSGSMGGLPSPYAYYYSVDEGEYTMADSLTSPITIGGLMIEKQYTVTLIAQNSAGFTLPSNLAVGSPIYKQPIFNIVNASPPKDANADSGGSFAQDKSAFSKTYSPPPATIEDQQLQLQKNLIGGGRRSAEDVIRRKRVAAVGASSNPTGGDFSIMETSPNVTRRVVFRR